MSEMHPADGSTEGLPEGQVYLGGQVVPKGVADNFYQIYNWKVKDDDVWICTIPKAGTTWIQEMVWMIMNDLDFEKGKADLNERSPFIEASYVLPKGVKFDEGSFLANSLKYAKEKSARERVVLKTHLCWNLLPKEIQEGTKNPKMVYVFRNPKDCCVSYYHQHRLVWGYSESLEVFSEAFLSGTVRHLPFWNSVLPFWERRHQPNILFIRYEEMIKDLPAVIRQVAKFLDKTLTDDQVDILANHLSFSSMKNNPAVNKEKAVNMFKKIHSVEGVFMRKGKAGGYKEEMNEDTIKKFDEWIELNIKGSDLVLEYV